MILSRKWLNEFVDVSDISDREFDEAMTLSGSKVETVTALDESLKNVVVGKILSMEKHPDSDHMWICQIDVGQAEPTQIVTGAWNIHVGDLVPVAQHKSLLPGGVKIEKGKLRGVESNGMLCSLKELNLTAEHDYPYAVITPAALLNDYKPLDPEKPSIPADIKAGLQPPRRRSGGLQYQDGFHLHPLRPPCGAGGVPPLHPRRYLRAERGREARRRYGQGHRRGRSCG